MRRCVVVNWQNTCVRSAGRFFLSLYPLNFEHMFWWVPCVYACFCFNIWPITFYNTIGYNKVCQSITRATEYVGNIASRQMYMHLSEPCRMWTLMEGRGCWRYTCTCITISVKSILMHYLCLIFQKHKRFNPAWNIYSAFILANLGISSELHIYSNHLHIRKLTHANCFLYISSNINNMVD